MTDYRIWEAERPAVAARYRFIAYNQRYNTRSLWTLAAQTMATCAQHGELVTIPGSNHDAIVRQPAALTHALPILWRGTSRHCSK